MSYPIYKLESKAQKLADCQYLFLSTSSTVYQYDVGDETKA